MRLINEYVSYIAEEDIVVYIFYYIKYYFVVNKHFDTMRLLKHNGNT